MKVSDFLVVANDGEDYLVYSTLTTGFVKLNAAIYKSIFVNHDFSDTEIAPALKEMGILHDDGFDELKYLDNLRKLVIDSDPSTVVVLVTTACNARCAYCFEEGIPQYLMTRETADETVNFIAKTYVRSKDKLNIGWFGGESLLAFDTIKYILEKLTALGFHVSSRVTTNGSLITDAIVEYSSKHHFTAYQITIDGLGEDYGRIKNYKDISVQGAYSRTIHGIYKLLNGGIKVLLRINFAVDKVEEAKNVFSALLREFSGYAKDALVIYLAPLTLNENGKLMETCGIEESHPYYKMMIYEFEQGFTLSDRNNSFATDKIDSATLQRLSLMPIHASCGMTVKNAVAVNADGTLYKCHRLAGKKQFQCGDVYKGIEHNEVYRYFSAETIEDTECLTCCVLPLCQGGCKGTRLSYGDSNKCDKVKYVKEQMLKFFYKLKKEEIEHGDH